jgi:hypothetical protein
MATHLFVDSIKLGFELALVSIEEVGFAIPDISRLSDL